MYTGLAPPGTWLKTVPPRSVEAGRQTEIANYDRAGKLLRKDIRECQEDANENWTEQKAGRLDVTSGSKPPKLGVVRRRHDFALLRGEELEQMMLKWSVILFLHTLLLISRGQAQAPQRDTPQ